MLTVYLLDRIISGEKPSRAGYLLPFVMLAWSNIHGAYILGDIIILIYSGSWFFNLIVRKRKTALATPAILLISVVVSFVNPTGISGFIEMIRFFSEAKPNYITEYFSPLFILRNYGQYNPSFWICILAYIAIIPACFRKIEIHHALLMLFIIILTLGAYRHTPYALIIMPMVAAYFAGINKKFLTVATVAGAIVFIVNAPLSNAFQFKTDNFFPENSSKILKETKPDGRIFNHMSWGGYLMVKNPEYPVFIDGRALSDKLISRYILAFNGQRWQDIFAYYGINTVLVPILVLNESTDLIPKLLQEESWDVLYYGYNEVIFVKKTPHNLVLIKMYGSKKLELAEKLKKLSAYQRIL
jgi:hypothetical protein